MDTIEPRLKDIFTHLFQVKAEDIRPESSPQTIPAWDSVQNLHMIMDIEETFSISITEDDVENMKTFADIAAIIKSHHPPTA